MNSYALPTLAEILEDAPSEMLMRCQQRRLVAIFEGMAWLDALQAAKAFDAGNAAHATVRDREAVRLISNSQPGAGAFLLQVPDVTVPGSVRTSVETRMVADRKLGLYVADLAQVFDAREARGLPASQHERLGDGIINDRAAQKTSRHNAGLAALHDAFRCAAHVDDPVKLGDKGDGSPGSRERAKERMAWLNLNHIADMWKTGSPPTMIEWKCYTCFLAAVSAALGRGSARCGGHASTADGGSFAFGNTLEALIVKVRGVAARGDPADPPLDRRTGVGRVDAADGDYADGLSKGHLLHLYVAETTGALCPNTVDALKGLDRAARSSSGYDSTSYGQSRSSPKSFYAHHLANISCSIVYEGARALRDWLSHTQRSLAAGAM